MKKIFTKAVDAPDLMATTDLAKTAVQDAFNLGTGDATDLESAGLIALSNAAVTVLDNIAERKERDKRLDDFMYEQLRKSLEDIHAEIEWLDEQIKTEEKAIQVNNAEIDFIRTLNEDNILDADGNVRDDVKAILKKHGYDDVDGMEVAEIMLITQAIETELHSDNIERKARIGEYQERVGDLQRSVERFQSDMPDGTPQDIQDSVREIAEREPYEVSFFARKETYLDNDVAAETINKVEEKAAEAIITDAFKPF